jgi:tight adherence protein C
MIEIALALLFGGALMAGAYAVYQIFAEVPDEDRTYLDRPPVGFRLAWPLVQLLVYYLGPHLSMKYRLKTQARLKRAGVDFSVSPEQFFVGKLLSAGLFAFLMWIVLNALGSDSLFWMLASVIGGFYYPDLWAKELTEQRQKLILRHLPFYLDLITLCVEAGTNLTGAFTQAMQKGPGGPLKAEINRLLRDIRSGRARAEALRGMAERIDMPAMTTIVSTLVQAEAMGTSLGPILRAQADQRRTERFLRAEKLAMEAPVKLLAPLMMFIFPNTFLILGFVLIAKAVQEGVIAWPWLVYLLR